VWITLWISPHASFTAWRLSTLLGKDEDIETFKVENVDISRYGGRAVTEECPIAIIVMSFQSIVGVVIQVKSEMELIFSNLYF
jgi:hypothetical protein